MTITEIADKINKLASGTSQLKDLQVLRAEIKSMEAPRTYKIFSASTIFEDEDCEYAFHDGGRSELQFNIGKEYIGQEEIFRYGLAFSLEPNQSQPDPINFITPKIHAFNEFLENNLSFFEHLSLWHYNKPGHTGRSDNFPVSSIPSAWIAWGNFIFVGRYFAKPMDEVSEEDISEIVRLFNYLMPLFLYVENNYLRFKLPVAGNRVSRICWNTKGWVEPSGRMGKSDDIQTHEGKYGYGHEEWLGDISKTIDGYHYSFLESVRKEQDAFEGNVYNVDLFSINGENSHRYFIGSVNNMEVIDSATASAVKEKYEKNGWLEHMEKQIVATGANKEGFSNWNGIDLFNVRFKPKDLHFFSNYLFTEDKNILKIKRYSFAHKVADIASAIPLNKEFSFVEDSIITDEIDGDIETSGYFREACPVEITYLHKKIRDRLHRKLIEIYGNCIGKENPTGQGTAIDLVRKEGDRIVFYEIKTFYNIKSCIREAVGQLLEYAFWPDVENAHELIIVSQNEITEDSKRYLSKIRQTYGLPIYYQYFDLDNYALSEKY